MALEGEAAPLSLGLEKEAYDGAVSQQKNNLSQPQPSLENATLWKTTTLLLFLYPITIRSCRKLQTEQRLQHTSLMAVTLRNWTRAFHLDMKNVPSPKLL